MIQDYNNYSVLIAEDNYINQKLMRKLLQKLGYKCDIVDDGAKVVDLLQEKQFDIILMDIQMPVMDGYEATRKIRESEKYNGRHIPIVAVTAFAMERDRQLAYEAGMDDFLPKPFSKNDFYYVIEKHIRSKNRIFQ